MHTLLTKRIEIPWTRILKGIAVLLALLSWAYILAVVLFWGRIDDYLLPFFFTGIACCFGSSFAVLLFTRLRGDSDTTRASAFWILWASAPILLIPIIAGFYMLFAAGAFVHGLGHMHDSM
jgi:hypothetical protein